MPQDLAAGSFKYTVQPTNADLNKMNQIGRRVARYHNMPGNKRVFMQSGAKPNDMMPRLHDVGSYDTRSHERNVMGHGFEKSDM